MKLIRCQLPGIADIQYLKLCHSLVGGISGTGVTNRQPVVSGWGHLDFKSDDEVIVNLLGEQVAAFSLLALNGSIDDLVIVDGTSPTTEILAVEDRFKTEVFGGRPQDLVGFLKGLERNGREVSPDGLAPQWD